MRFAFDRSVGYLAFALALLAAAAMLGFGGIGWSSSATPWLDALALRQGGPAHGALGRVVRDCADLFGMRPATAMSAAAWGLGLLHVALLTGAGWRCLGARAAWLVPALALLWPVSRQSIQLLSAEGVMASAGLMLAVGASDLLHRPRRGALMVGLALLTFVLAHPVGMPAALGAALIVALWPRPETSAKGRRGFAIRPIWTAWLAALLLCGGGLLLARPDGGIKTLWLAVVATIRPTATPEVAGGLADLPLFGPVFGALARTPPAIALLAAAMALFSLARARRGPLAPFAALTAWWALLAALFAHPTPGAFDPLAVAAPGIVVLAAAALRTWFVGLWRTASPIRAPIVAALASALTLSVVADGVAIAPPDPRTGLAHLLDMMGDPSADLPAILLPADLRLLQDQAAPTTILPGMRDGAPLAMALARSGILAAPARYYAPFSSDRVLLHLPAGDPISAQWRARLSTHACTPDGGHCLFSLERRGLPEAPSARRPSSSGLTPKLRRP